MSTGTGDAAGGKPRSGGYKVWSFITEYSILLITGAILALLWANLDPKSYHHFVEYPLLFNDWIGMARADWVADYGADAAAYAQIDAAKVLTVHYLINDALMALFFAIAGKEVWEAVALRDGSLRGRKALTPLVATAGGIIGPVAIYFAIAGALGQLEALGNGWAVPTATDIAFSYLIGRLIFGAGHPAVRFLLLLAIADDAAGLIIVAVVYPSGELALEWLLLSFGAAALVYLVFNYLPRLKDTKRAARRSGPRVRSMLGAWPYVVGGLVSWFGFTQAGIHPALGLLPIIPAIPHADNAHGFFADSECASPDLLNRLEHALKSPVEVVLMLFGLVNAGVLLSSINAATWSVLGGLLIGKPIGIFLFGMLAARTMKLGLPDGMRSTDLVTLGMIAAIGFTVSLFMASVAFEPGVLQEGAKMGALLSFAAAGAAFGLARIFPVDRVKLS